MDSSSGVRSSYTRMMFAVSLNCLLNEPLPVPFSLTLSLAELSGDMRVDLSTPLLDTLNDKLTEASLDCKTLAYDPSKLPSFEDLTTVTSQQVISQQVTGPVITPAPTVTLDCSDGVTGPRQHDGCTGYYFCVYGKAVYPFISCPENSLFDEKSMLCLPSEQVTCSGTSSPTNAPSRRSTTLSPSNHPNQLLSSSPSISSSYGESSSTSSSPTDDTSPPTWLHEATTNTRPKESSSPTIQYPNRMPTSFPSDGSDPDASQAPMPSPNNQTSSSNQTSTSQTFGEESVISQAANDTEDEDPLFVCNHDSYTGMMTLDGCSEYFYCLNGVPQIPSMKCDTGFLFDTSSNSCTQASRVICEQDQPMNHSTTHHTTTSTTLHQPDNVTSPANLINSQLSGDVTSNDYVSTNSSLQYSNPSITGRNPGTMMYSWSVFTTYSTSSSQGSIPAPNSLLSQNSFPGDDPFITIEISFNNTSPDDIGWQLLSLDEVVNINQPVGAYKDMAALNTIVYESIVLKQTSIKRSAIREYSWSIINMKGKFDGQYKIYAGSPNSKALVVLGSDFIYMDTVGLVATDDGVFLASSDALDDKKPAIDDKGVVSVEEPLADSAQKVNEAVQIEAEDYQQEEDSQKTSLMIPILISLVLLALIGGVGLIICAFRKKKEDMNESDLTGDFDDWDVEARPKELETASSSSSFYDTSCLSGMDPPGGSTASVFNSYESKPVADINTDIVNKEDPPPDSEQQQQLTAVNDFLIDLRAAVDSLNNTEAIQRGTDMSANRLLTETGIISSNPQPIDDSYRHNQVRAFEHRRNSGVDSICLEPPSKS